MTLRTTYQSNAVDHFFTTMGRYQLLETSEVIELSRKVQNWQKHQDGPVNCSPIVKRIGIASRDKLVRHNLRLVIKIWRDKYSARIKPGHSGLADLLQLGSQGLIRAAEMYDASKGHKFSTYAATWIHKGMKDYLASEERLVRLPSNNYFLTKAAMRLQSDRSAIGLPELSMDELVSELAKTRRNVPSPKTLSTWINSYNTTNARSFAEPIGDGASLLGDFIADTTIDDNEQDNTAERTREALGYLTEFERSVLEKRYFCKRNQPGHRSIARVLKSTEEDVRQAEQRAFKRIRLFVCR